MESGNPILPTELWRQILEFVPPRYLRNVVLASRRMNSVASLPKLWVLMKVNMGKLRENGLAQFYNINRFSRIQRLDFKDVDLTTEDLKRLFKDIPDSLLKNITISWEQFGLVSQEALGKMVEHLKTFTVKRPGLITTDALVKLENVLQSVKAVIINLDLSSANLTQVPGDLLAKIISQLTSVDMVTTNIINNQWGQVLEATLISTTLVDVDLSFNYLRGVQPDLLAGAIRRLRKIILRFTHLTTEQSSQVVKAVNFSVTLVEVDLSWNNLRSVEAELLAGAVRRLHKVKLEGTRLTIEQSFEVVKAVNSSTTLVKVDLSCNNLRNVEVDLLAGAVHRLHKINLRRTELEVEQCTEVVNAISSSTTLVDVNLSCNILSSVEADLLAEAVGRLRKVRLWCTSLTTLQFTELVKAVNSSTTLEDVELRGNHIREKVPADLLNTLPRNVARY